MYPIFDVVHMMPKSSKDMSFSVWLPKNVIHVSTIEYWVAMKVLKSALKKREGAPHQESSAVLRKNFDRALSKAPFVLKENA